MTSKIVQTTASAFALGLGLTMTATPAAAQVACDLNGAPGVPGGSIGADSLQCGSLDAAFNVSDDSTIVGENVKIGGDSVTAVGAFSGVITENAILAGAYSPPTESGATAIGAYALAVGTNAVAIGDQAIVGDLDLSGGTLGVSSFIANATAVGSHTLVSASNSTAIGAQAVATHTNSVALGAGTATTADNQVHVGGRTIGGVAAGVAATDAVNVSPLNAISVVATGLDTRIDALEAIALDFDEDLDRIDDRASAGTATAIALGGNAFLPDKQFNLTGNMGLYRGAYAGAIQVGAMVSPNAAFNAGVAKGFNKGGKLGARVGFTFGW